MRRAHDAGSSRHVVAEGGGRWRRRMSVVALLSTTSCYTSCEEDEVSFGSVAPTPTPPVPSHAVAPSRNALASARASSPLRRGEDVIVFPALATWNAEGRGWRLSVRLWVHRAATEGGARRPAPTRTNHDALASDLTDHARTRPHSAALLAEPVAGRRLTLEIGRLLVKLPPADAEGHVRAEVDVPLDVMPPREGTLEMRVVTPEGDPRELVGSAHFVTPTGKLVVYDMRGAMTESALAAEPEMVDGMGDALTRLLEPHGHLHGLSSWPHQLYPTKRAAFEAASIPEGTFELRRWHPPADLDALFRPDSIEEKLEGLQALAKRLPSRRWILVGDSGGTAPETFGAFARDHAGLVLGIYIHDVTGEARSEPRYREAFASIPDDRWRLFSTGHDL